MKVDPRMKWWKLKKEECGREFKEEEIGRYGRVTRCMTKEAAKKVFCISYGQRKVDKETW